MEWPNPLFDSIYNFLTGVEELFKIPNVKDIMIYNRIESQNNYKIEFKKNSLSMFADEIIELCS